MTRWPSAAYSVVAALLVLLFWAVIDPVGYWEYSIVLGLLTGVTVGAVVGLLVETYRAIRVSGNGGNKGRV